MEFNFGHEDRLNGHVLLNLDSHTISAREAAVPLDIEHLLAVLEIPDQPANRLTLQYLLDVLDDCHTGQLPRPCKGLHLRALSQNPFRPGHLKTPLPGTRTA